MATAAQIQAEIAAGPQTQDALDAILVKYSPAELAAALPQYGGVDDYANARAEAERREFIAWQAAQPDPIGQGTIGDRYAAQGITDPKNDPRVLEIAQQQIDRAQRREDLFEQAGINPGDLRPWSDAPPPTVGGGFVTGGGTPSKTVVGGGIVQPGGLLGGGAAPTAPAAGGGLLGGAAPAAPAAQANPRIQSIQQWYNANAGRTDPQAQGDLNRFLATSGYTAREINAALPQWGLNDLQNAMRTAIGEVAGHTCSLLSFTISTTSSKWCVPPEYSNAASTCWRSRSRCSRSLISCPWAQRPAAWCQCASRPAQPLSPSH